MLTLKKIDFVHCRGRIADSLQEKRKKFQNKRKNQVADSSELKKFPCKKFRKVSSGRFHQHCSRMRGSRVHLWIQKVDILDILALYHQGTCTYGDECTYSHDPEPTNEDKME